MKLSPGCRVAVLSPAFAAPTAGPEVHEQAMSRLTESTGLIPVEYPTTRRADATAAERAADVNAAFADPAIGAVLATVGGYDQITVIPHLDDRILAANPKPFLGYSDNTNLLNHLWRLGVPGFYGGSTQVHLGAGPGIDDIHLASLRAALLDGGTLELTDPGESEDFGRLWETPEALQEYGERTPTGPWSWDGPAHAVTGPTWGGCLEVLDELAIAGRLPDPDDLDGAILLLETSELLPSADWVGRWVRALGERGILGVVAGVLVARPPVSYFEDQPDLAERDRRRVAQRDAVVEQVERYNPEAVVCVGVPFGHTRPQLIVPYGGTMTLDGSAQKVFADYT